MMYHKALLMGDTEIAAETLESKSPAEAKNLGRKVRGFKREVWDRWCDDVVERGQILKFEQNEELKGVLLGTGEREIVETSPNDRLWGIGFNTEEAEEHISEWGENKLGKALMRARQKV
ncbi:DUF1768-domain-containing protein, partial [Polychaeton citri CBS 116435]